MSTNDLHPKGLASLLTTFSFVVMSLSGILLFIVPQGRIAEWTDWHMLGLTKTQWGDIHITTSLMFLISGAFHIWLNWNTLVNYFTAKRDGGLMMMRREMAIAALMTAFFLAGAVFQVPPLSYVLTLNNTIKQAWIVDKDHEPPMGHAELLTMPSFAKKLQMDLDQVTGVLKRNGVTFKDSESLAVIAKNHSTSPVKLYQLIKPLEGSAAGKVAAAAPAHAAAPAPATAAAPATVPAAAPATAKQQVYTDELVDEKFEGRGMGRKTLPMIAEETGLDLAKAKKKLAARNISVKDDETLKDAAAKAGLAPIELLKTVFVGEPIKN